MASSSAIQMVDNAHEAGALLALLANDEQLGPAVIAGSSAAVPVQHMVRRKRGGNKVRAKVQNKHLVLRTSVGGETYSSECVHARGPHMVPASPRTHPLFFLQPSLQRLLAAVAIDLLVRVVLCRVVLPSTVQSSCGSQCKTASVKLERSAQWRVVKAEILRVAAKGKAHGG